MSAVISVENLGKLYRLGETGTGSLAHDVNRWWHRIRGREDPYRKVGVTNDRSRAGGVSDYVWALRDVSFDVHNGEVLGIIGRNGAGKSTLLKLLSRVTAPTTGRIRAKGRIASLLEVGTGFHPELTGRENIFLNGAILGMRRAEIGSKLDEIVEFSGCAAYLDTPVKRYSSGMVVRLGFSVAAYLDAEILIVDEVLAVGDSEFQKRCLGKMHAVAKDGRTVLLVSHNMGVMANLCRRALLLEQGTVSMLAEARDVIGKYLAGGNRQSGESSWDEANAPGSGVARLLGVRLSCEGEIGSDFLLSKPIDVELQYENLRDGAELMVSIHLIDRIGNCVLATANLPSAVLGTDAWGHRPHPPGRFRSVCRIPAHFLNSDEYWISAFVVAGATSVEAEADHCVSFRAHDDGEMRREYSGEWIGMIRPRLEWRSEQMPTEALTHS
jgi:lipopolysaccharide transport system ATP-binding protein